MSLEQTFPFLYGKKHGYVRRLDIKTFERHLKSLNFFDRYFRVSFEGLDNIPAQGGALIVGNHGPGGFDAPFVIKHVYEERGRVVRAMADRAVFKLPLYRIFANQFGIVEGERNQAIEMLADGNLMSVYPGGIRETVKRPDQKYEIRPFWGKANGFIKCALKAQVPIVPVACIGIDDIVFQVRTAEQMQDNWFMRRWQNEMGSDKYSTPMWAGLGPLPLPVKLSYYVGWPVHLGYGPEAADDPAVVAELKERVIVETEKLIEHGLAERERKRQRTMRAFGLGGRRLIKAAQRVGKGAQAAVVQMQRAAEQQRRNAA